MYVSSKLAELSWHLVRKSRNTCGQWSKLAQVRRSANLSRCNLAFSNLHVRKCENTAQSCTFCATRTWSPLLVRPWQWALSALRPHNVAILASCLRFRIPLLSNDDRLRFPRIWAGNVAVHPSCCPSPFFRQEASFLRVCFVSNPLPVPVLWRLRIHQRLHGELDDKSRDSCQLHTFRREESWELSFRRSNHGGGPATKFLQDRSCQSTFLKFKNGNRAKKTKSHLCSSTYIHRLC